MGNNQSAVDPVHVRMYSNMIQIRDPLKRIQVIQTCLASMEYVNSAKRCGIYSYLLHYLSTVQSGGQPSVLPGEPSSQQAQASHSQHTQQQAVSVPRSLQHNFVGGIGATHPSMLNAPNATTYQQPSHNKSSQQIVTHTSNEPTWKVITDTPKQKAISYFASCLEVLNIQEEVALTEETLKVAYKKMALRSHPDKGGSEEYFEAVTRAYAYLSEILKFMKGGKRDTGARVDATHMSQAQQSRESDSKKWDYGGEPVRLNAKNLDMNAFNKLFEQTHMPDPDSDGYGDWLKDANGGNGGGQKFKGEFNRDVFNRMFEDEARKGPKQSTTKQSSALMVHPGQMALTLNPTSGVDLVGERPDSYTAAPNSRFQFTDLRGAYTSDSTISDKVANVAVHDRTFEQYRASREKAPEQFNQSELHSIREFEQRQSAADEMRERKRAEMHMKNQQYHDRMKQMVITDGVDLNQKKIGY
jgi:curved DNA-binding protein CbpA